MNYSFHFYFEKNGEKEKRKKIESTVAMDSCKAFVFVFVCVDFVRV